MPYRPALSLGVTYCVIVKMTPGSGGIRTHAPEETGALIQRLRPLGHATVKDASVKKQINMHVTAKLCKRFWFSVTK